MKICTYYAKIKTFLFVTVTLSGLPVFVMANQQAVLSLSEAEQIALDIDPTVKGLQARAEGFAEQAVAEGQLPDPRFKLGAMNLPIDTFDRAQEPMTQLQFGLVQSIPPGRTLHYRRERTEALSDVEKSRGQERSLRVVRETRLSYLESYYRIVSEEILKESRTLFSELLTVTQRQYAAGRDNQHDVLRAQLELSLMDDRILEVAMAKEMALAELSKYITREQASRPIQEKFPALQEVPEFIEIKQGLTDHPAIKIEDASLLASRKRILEVEQQYKPGLSFDLTYGERSGTGFDGGSRPDMLSAMVMIDIPLFTGKRQDKRLAAAKKQSLAVQFGRTDRLYELLSLSEREYASWQRLNDRLALYESRASLDAKLNADSTLKAYQNDLTDFTTLMRARLTELNTKLDMLRVRVERAKTQARLLYLAGEMS